jgi:hypothetical protein
VSLYEAIREAVQHGTGSFQIDGEYRPAGGNGSAVKTTIYAGLKKGESSLPIGDRHVPNRPEEGVQQVATIMSAAAARNVAEIALVDKLPDLSDIFIHAPEGASEAVRQLLPIRVSRLPHSLAATHQMLTDISDEVRHAIISSGPADARWLYENYPIAIVSGFWFASNQGLWPSSHPYSKMEASLHLEIMAIDAIQLGRGMSAIDPVILSTSGMTVTKEGGRGRVGLEFGATKNKDDDKISKANLGSIVSTYNAGTQPWVTARYLLGNGYISVFPAKSLNFPDWPGDRVLAARTTMVALTALAARCVGDQEHVRSGADLVSGGGLSIVDNRTDQPLVYTTDEAVEAVRQADAAAVAVGAPSIFGSRIDLTANDQLTLLIDNGVKARPRD